MSSWGIQMELIWIAMHTLCHLGEGSLHLAHVDGPPYDIAHSTRGGILSADISYPEFRLSTFRIWRLTSGWERRTFQLLRSDISGSCDSTYPESFSLSIQCRGVLLKLPDISDRHLEIFCFRYLLSKSPKSPCNPPVI